MTNFNVSYRLQQLEPKKKYDGHLSLELPELNIPVQFDFRIEDPMSETSIVLEVTLSGKPFTRFSDFGNHQRVMEEAAKGSPQAWVVVLLFAYFAEHSPTLIFDQSTIMRELLGGDSLNLTCEFNAAAAIDETGYQPLLDLCRQAA